MKKLVLALLIALGAVNANVVANTSITTQQITDAIASSSLDDKNVVLEWVNNHRLLTASIIGAVALSSAYLVDHFANDAKARNYIAGTEAYKKANEWKDKAWAGVKDPKGTYNIAKKWVTQDKTHMIGTGAVAVATLAVIVYAIYDLRKDTADSEIKKLYRKLFNKEEAQEVKEEVAPAA